MSGWIIPAPLAIPPMVTVVPLIWRRMAEVLANASVVRMASAADAPSALSAAGNMGMPPRSASIGSGIPITPVLATRTNSSAMPSA